MKPISQAEFERDIADDFDEYRMELRVEQVTPLLRIPRAAYLPVRRDRMSEASKLADHLSDRATGMVKLVDGAFLKRPGRNVAWYATLADRHYIEVCHHADRNYAGYANVYRAIKRAAPLVDDCRFFIKEDYARWVDEYRIQAGSLWFERRFADTEFADALRAYWIERAHDEPDDVALTRFTAWLIADHAEYLLGSIEKKTTRDEEFEQYAAEARSYLDIALALDPRCHHAIAQSGRYFQIHGDGKQAGVWLTRAAEMTDEPDPDSMLGAVLAAITDGDYQAAELRADNLVNIADEHKAGWMLSGWLAARDGREDQAADAWSRARTSADNPHRDAIFRAGIHADLLDRFFGFCEDALGDDPGDEARRALARDILDWAEFFRIMDAHDRDREPSRALATALYARARQWSELGGDVLYCMGIHHKLRPGLPDRPELFEQALDVNPDHLKALGEVGSAAHKAGDYSRAIEPLTRYIEISERTSSGSYARQMYYNIVMDCHYRIGWQHIDNGDLQAAHVALDAAIALYPKLGYSQRKFEGPLVGKGDAYALAGDHDAALLCYDKALELNQNSPHAWSSKGSSLNNLGRYEDAIECYELALAAKDDYWHPYYCKACTLALTGGDRREIYALLDKALSLEPSKRALIAGEADFSSLRDDPEFQALVSADS